MTDNGYAVTAPWTWRDRLCARLFPTQWVQTPEAPPHFEDVLFVNVTCVLDWKDRFRLLVCGRLRVNTRVVCEHKPGATVSASVSYPLLGDLERRS